MKRISIFCLSLLPVLVCFNANAQIQTISGKVLNKVTGQVAIGVTVSVKQTHEKTITDANGEFKISTSHVLPVILVFTSVEFNKQELTVTTTSKPVDVSLNVSVKEGDIVVVSANRKPTKIIDAPVSIERYGYQEIAGSPATSYYDHALYKKGIDITTSGYLFKTISTRGFNGSGSTRVNQLVDGMDNQAPGLNFFVGNFAGIIEPDVENIEILPGASSALYGPGGMNGTVLIQSKNPFDYRGISVQAKQGIMHVNNSQGATAFYDYSLRWAKAFKNKYAFKICAQYIKAKDWIAGDTSNYARNGSSGNIVAGNRQTDPNYDGVNVYGDETSANIYDMKISRTGYHEHDVIDNNTKNIKLTGALHYKINSRLEAQLAAYWATGNTVYTGNNRYVLKDIKIGQYKLELKHRNWFLRTYTTQEDAGKAYSATVATQYFNEAWKPSEQWYTEYVGNFFGAKTGGASDQQAHEYARSQADIGRPAPGSAQFQHLFDSVKSRPISMGGGLFLEKSQLWMTEGQYNLSNTIKFVDFVIGGNWKRYILNSEGTLFIDKPGTPITFNEYGAYAEVAKKLFADKLALSFSGRYDKNENFSGHFTPRATALIKLAKDNHLRLSYQTAYRFPSTQQKYIKLNVGDYILLGGLPWVLDTMNIKATPVVDASTGMPYSYKELKPENCSSFEIGYKGAIGKNLLIDAYAYFSRYRDFLGRNVLYQPATNTVYSTVVNSSTKVKIHGFGLSADYRTGNNYSIFVNVYSDVITDVPTGFQAYFNTARYRLNAGFGNTGFGKNKLAGFNIILHWQNAFHSEGELATGPVSAFTTIDAQVNYKLPKINSIIKLGGTNILNHYYKNAFANPEIGGLYYLSFAYNLSGK